MQNPSLNDLVGGITSVTLGDDAAKARGNKKTVSGRVQEVCEEDEWGHGRRVRREGMSRKAGQAVGSLHCAQCPE